MPRHKKQRRERGDGGLYQRADGRWCASIDLAPEFPGGPRRRKVFYGKTKEEARDRRMAWAVGAKDQLPVQARGTLGEFLEYWLANVIGLKIADSSFRAYRISIHHLKPIYPILLEKLTSEQIQTHIAKLTRARGAYVAYKALAKLDQALKYAVKTKRRRDNPATAVEGPRPTKKKPIPLTTEQAHAFIAAVEGHPYEAGFWLSLCGLRTGEVRGAKWEDVDWEKGTIVVQRQARYTKGGSELGKTKTEGSIRTVFLVPQAMDALRRARDVWRLSALARTPEARDLIVVSKKGKILAATTYGCAYRAVLKAAKIPHTPLHNLRHTFASLAMDAGASPTAVQAQLGHKTIDMTFAYAHPSREGQSRAAEVYGEAIKAKKAR